MLGAMSFAIAGTDALRVLFGFGAVSADPAAVAPRLMSVAGGGV